MPHKLLVYMKKSTVFLYMAENENLKRESSFIETRMGQDMKKNVILCIFNCHALKYFGGNTQ